MPNQLTITAATNTLRLDAERRAETQFTVFNSSGQQMRARARLVPQNPAAEKWLTLAGEVERDLPIAGTQQYVVQINVPPDAPAGSYTFRLDVVGVENPDEELTQGPSVAFEVPPPEPVKKPFPIWIPIAAILALVVIVGIIVAIILERRRADQENANATTTAIAIQNAAATVQAQSTQTAIASAARYNGTWVKEAGQIGGISRLVIASSGQTITLEITAELLVWGGTSGPCTGLLCPVAGCSMGQASTTYAGDPLTVSLKANSEEVGTARPSYNITLTLLPDNRLDAIYTYSAESITCPGQSSTLRRDTELRPVPSVPAPIPSVPGPVPSAAVREP